jgi:hypothetical protein
MSARQAELTREEEFKYADLALRWHGWGSPVGLGLFIVAVAAAAAILRFAFWG